MGFAHMGPEVKKRENQQGDTITNHFFLSTTIHISNITSLQILQIYFSGIIRIIYIVYSSFTHVGFL